MAEDKYHHFNHLYTSFFHHPVELRKGIVRDGPRANQAINEFHYIEDTFSREKLLDLLEKGITYYNNDLTWEERDLIETYVRKGEIKVVCATTTLSMEINPTYRLPRLYRRGTHLDRLLSVPVYREFALIPTLTDGEFPLY